MQVPKVDASSPADNKVMFEKKDSVPPKEIIDNGPPKEKSAEKGPPKDESADKGPPKDESADKGPPKEKSDIVGTDNIPATCSSIQLPLIINAKGQINASFVIYIATEAEEGEIIDGSLKTNLGLPIHKKTRYLIIIPCT